MNTVTFIVVFIGLIWISNAAFTYDYRIFREHFILTSMNCLLMVTQLILVLCQKKDFLNVKQHWNSLVDSSITDLVFRLYSIVVVSQRIQMDNYVQENIYNRTYLFETYLNFDILVYLLIVSILYLTLK